MIRALKKYAFLFLTILLSACDPPNSDVLRMGLANAPVTLDPRFATDATSARINRLLYRRLTEFDDQTRPVPSLARWRILSPRHYRFTLMEDIPSFITGEPLTSKDIKATFDYMLDATHGSPHRATLEMIERIEAPDAHNVDFFLNRPDPLFPGHLSIGILPAESIATGHRFQNRGIGNGPFRMIDWSQEERLVLERRADRRRIEFLTVKDPTVRVLKLLKGEIDMLQNDIPPELIGYLEQQESLKVARTRGTNFSYIGFNLQDPITGKRAVRRAIAHAIDREAIIRFVLGGAALEAQALLPSSHWAGASHLEPHDYAPDKARRLLKQAGFDERHTLKLVYKTSSDPFRVRLATIIQSQLARVGIQVDVRSYDWGTFYGDIKAGRFQMYSLAWVGIKMPEIFRYAFHSRSLPPDGANRGRFASAVVDRLIEKAERQPTIELQAPLYYELEARLLHELPYVPLWYEDQVFVSRQTVEGYAPAGDGNYDGLVQVRRRSEQEVGQRQ